MNDHVQNPFAVAQRNDASSALAVSDQARGVAEVQAKLLMAQQFPRDQVQAMDNILNAFTRPRLAEVAKYQFSRGGSEVDGPSIRSAETIAQNWGNMEFGFREVARGRGTDGVTYSEVEAFAFDLQSRTRRQLQFQVRHWRDTKKGGYPIKDERDIYELMSNMAQRRVRACILAIVPGDVIDAAMEQAEVTLKSKADTSAEAMQKMVDAFAPFGVSKDHIEKRIQRRLESIQPAQVVSLKKIYASLRDGMSMPSDWFDVEDASPATEGQSLKDLKSRAASKKAADPAAPFDPAPILQQITEAASIDALDLVADSFRDAPDEHYDALQRAYQNRRAELDPAA
ncbi:hypothetical protein [Bordetella bronchiseptica]|uniref:hypothetical protein n=1 Tax=Bordetella bronchiseptica TaxID=518 RepID=UPI000460C296|nr:hypothetical protein [Bordetella bronchiseptica]KDD21245.1 hypothetical protein L525_3537 [Bordetella bronchiseptica MBORD782]VTQ77748.1 Uncharacterised protein [Bordetella bronchiseptica]